MDIATLKARAEAARTLVHEHAGARYTLLVPTRHAARVAWLTHRGAAAPVLAERQILEAGIVGWDGVTVGHILGPDAKDAGDAVPWSAEAVALILDADPSLEAALSKLLSDAAESRAARLGAAEKN